MSALRKEAKRRLRHLRELNPGSRLYEAQLHVARSYGFTSWRSMHEHVGNACGKQAEGSLAEQFLTEVGRGTFASASAFLERHPEVLNQNGPHPFWGGLPQALHVTIERDKARLFKSLLEAGADPSGSNDDYDGWSPLMLAIHWKRSKMMDALLAAGARVGLSEALMLGDDEAVLGIIESDPDQLFEPMPNDGTPLHFCRTARSAHLLLDQGVDPHQTDKYGKTALDSAIGSKSSDQEVIEVLRRHLGNQSINAGHLAAMGDLKGLKTWLDHNPNGVSQTFTVQWQPQSLLHIAAERAHDELVKWLLDQGADPNQTDQDGLTALHAAAWNGHLSTVKLLIYAGADPHARDTRYNNTPQGYAENNWESVSRPGCDRVAEWLKERA